MMIHEVTEKAGAYKARKRIGRGPGSGTGKTAGRGHKGYFARSGSSRRATSEGGQMPYFRRIPKRGFTNVQFMTQFWIVNLVDILNHDDFKKGGAVTAERLVKAGLIRDTKRPLKILGDIGDAKELKVKMTIEAHRVSRKARDLVEKAGGSVKEFGTRRDKVRGVDRNSDDKSPKNLTKKLHRTSPKAKDAKAKAAPEAGAEE